MKKKKIYNSKTIRISLGDYALLDGISRQARITFAEALHLLITETAKRKAIVVPKAQIPMPAFKVPVARVALRYASQPAIASTSQPAIATNGDKVVALGIKPKGARYDD